MPVVNGVTFYLGESPAAKNARPARNLLLDDNGSFCQFFHRILLKDQAGFTANVNLPELPTLELVWKGVGETAGVALWRREGRVGAASILLNGIELDQEMQSVFAHFTSQQLRLPSDLQQEIAKHTPPLLVTVHYDLRSYVDPLVVTAAETLANAFFTIFGTNDDEGEPEAC